jgi:hypothetical protein
MKNSSKTRAEQAQEQVKTDASRDSSKRFSSPVGMMMRAARDRFNRSKPISPRSQRRQIELQIRSTREPI